MGNIIAGYEKVTLAQKEYTLKFDYNSVCELEEYYNKGIASILTEEQVGLKLLRTFYFYALKWQFNSISMEQVGALLGKEMRENPKSNIGELMKPVMAALKKSKLLGGEQPKEDEVDVHLKNDEEENEEEFSGENFPE